MRFFRKASRLIGFGISSGLRGKVKSQRGFSIQRGLAAGSGLALFLGAGFTGWALSRADGVRHVEPNDSAVPNSQKDVLVSSPGPGVAMCSNEGGAPTSAGADGEAASKRRRRRRPRVLVLGSGWGAYSFLREIDLNRFDVTVLSPDSCFLFTPLLSGVATGSVSGASVMVELPVLLGHERASRIKFVQGTAFDVDFDKQAVAYREPGGHKTAVRYDRLVLAVGAVNHSYGLRAQVDAAPDVFRLRNLADAHKIRETVVRCFERAVQPGVPDEERDRLLSFAVVGGGAVSLDFAKSLRQYANYLTGEIHNVGQKKDHLRPRVTLVDVGDYNANAYDVKIAEQARGRGPFAGDGAADRDTSYIRAKVTKVQPGKLVLSHAPQQSGEDGDDAGGTTTPDADEPHPFGLCVWATARGPSPFVVRLQRRLGEQVQNNQHALITDDHLRVRGVAQSNVFALGDCGTISQGRLVESIVALFRQLDVNKDDQLSPAEFHALVENYQAEFPQLSEWASRTDQLFAEADVNNDGALSTDEFRALLLKVDADVTRLPSTAQVALQQGKYVARLLSNDTAFLSTRRGRQDISEGLYATDEHGNLPFRYKHYGGFEYIGYDNTITERGTQARSIIDGFGAWWLWTSIFFTWATPNRVLLRSSIDRVVSFLFGPDST